MKKRAAHIDGGSPTHLYVPVIVHDGYDFNPLLCCWLSSRERIAESKRFFYAIYYSSSMATTDQITWIVSSCSSRFVPSISIFFSPLCAYYSTWSSSASRSPRWEHRQVKPDSMDEIQSPKSSKTNIFVIYVFYI